MELRNADDTVKERLDTDFEFTLALLAEVKHLIRNGDVSTALKILELLNGEEDASS